MGTVQTAASAAIPASCARSLGVTRRRRARAAVSVSAMLMRLKMRRTRSSERCVARVKVATKGAKMEKRRCSETNPVKCGKSDGLSVNSAPAT